MDDLQLFIRTEKIQKIYLTTFFIIDNKGENVDLNNSFINRTSQCKILLLVFF
jgi:hypothetical protein